jgi:hypothetical protein
VVLFANSCADEPMRYTFVTATQPQRAWVATGPVEVRFDAAGRAVVVWTTTATSAVTIFFGVGEKSPGV